METQKKLINLDAELDGKIDYFKKHLEFGNTTHISLLDKISELGKLEAQLKSKRGEVRGMKSLEKKIDELKKDIVRRIDYQNQSKEK